MGTFRLSRRAKVELLEIAAYTFREWGEEQANRYIADLETCCQRLADNPNLGRACDDIRPGLRRMEHASHIVFYRVKDDGILVNRILHRRMLPQRHLIADD